MLICEKYRKHIVFFTKYNKNKIIKVCYASHIIYYYTLIGIQSIIQIIG